jgi:hypothetical protein
MSTDMPEPLDPNNEHLFASLQSIILAQERIRIKKLEDQINALEFQHKDESQALQRQVQELEAELDRLEQTLKASKKVRDEIQTKLELLQGQGQEDDEDTIARIKPLMSQLIGRTIHDSRDEMAEAMGPVMSEAIRVQIRDSRQEMVDALYPIIGDTVQRAISEFGRELQRNIDYRLKETFGPHGYLRFFSARLRGIAPSELALRDSLPFEIRELFLIQRGSGFLLAHNHLGTSEEGDRELISGMLTAISDFVRDSFGQESEADELDEIQYGELRIIIQHGHAAYLAVLIRGIEPEGFRTTLRDFVSELHIAHATALRNYEGEPDTLPNLQPQLAQLTSNFTDLQASRPSLGRNTKIVLAWGSFMGLLFVGLACFYLRFTLALLPVAFPEPRASLTPTLTHTISPTITFTVTASKTATATQTSTRTATASPSATPSLTSTPTVVLPEGRIRGNVWVRPEADFNAASETVALIDTSVKVLAFEAEWVEIEWLSDGKIKHGWVPLNWVILNSIPTEDSTP